MGKTGIRTIVLGAALLTVACGSRQSAGATTAAPTADAPEEPATVAVSESEPVVLKPDRDQKEERRRERPIEEPERRDVRMTSYEKAMARPAEVGDASVDGGEAQLSGEEIARFMDDRLDEMYEECIEKELRRSNELGTVTIDLAIRGKDGLVLGVTIQPGRRRFKDCLEDYLEDVRFPTFAAARMGARYRFHTD